MYLIEPENTYEYCNIWSPKFGVLDPNLHLVKTLWFELSDKRLKRGRIWDSGSIYPFSL